MSKQLAAAAMALASLAGSAAAESKPDIEGVLAPRAVGAAPARAVADPPSVALAWVDPARAATGLEALARDEARSLLQRMGVSVAWRRGEAGDLARPGEVRVILLDRGATSASGKPILGATPSRVEVEPYIWVHVPNVRAAMGVRQNVPAAALDLPSVRALGIALGRVVAHELVHALAPSAPHGTGLMSETLTQRQLTAARVSLDPGVGLAVRAALRGEPSLPLADTDVLAAAGKPLAR